MTLNVRKFTPEDAGWRVVPLHLEEYVKKMLNIPDIFTLPCISSIYGVQIRAWYDAFYVKSAEDICNLELIVGDWIVKNEPKTYNDNGQIVALNLNVECLKGDKLITFPIDDYCKINKS